VKRVIVIDDEQSMREMLGIMLRKEGFEVAEVDRKARVAEVLAQAPAHLIITDVKLPDGDGIEILREVKATSPETIVIVMTAYGSAQSAETALKLGAHDYLIKPFDIEVLKIKIRNELEKQRLREENLLLKAEFRSQHGLESIIGVSPAMAAVFERVRSVAQTASTILITGESGTGKELVAKAIHALSPRKEAPFVSVNCGALPETLLESELFGHMKGAFTDAHQNKKGLFEAAHRGTLFLDEVGATPIAMQVKLLRALQDKKIRRVGGTEESDIDVRLISATNQPLETLVRERAFREDLFYRLNVIPVHLPALRERREDIPLLAQHFLERFSREMKKKVARISSEVMERLVRYPWPGNVRELENVIERATALETTETILIEHLPDPVHAGDRPAPAQLEEGFNLDSHVRSVESDLVRRALDQAAGDRAAASRLLGITARSLRYLIQKYGLAGLR
jgi:two-component system, NtrC family, response regulator PilR